MSLVFWLPAGDKDNQIHFEGYQVSNQCMALVRDDCLIPTKDAPELGYVKESSEEQYVPDVFFKVCSISIEICKHYFLTALKYFELIFDNRNHWIMILWYAAT